MAQSNQARPPADDQDLLEQPSQRQEVSAAEDADGPEIGLLEPCHCRKVHPFDAGLGDLPGGEHPLRVSVKQQSDHHGRMERREPALLDIGFENGRKVQLLHKQVPHEM